MKKKLLVLLALMMALSMVVMTGCGGEDTDQDNAELTGWEYIEDKGVLVVGLDDTFAPMGFRDEANNLVGFDIDLANAVGEQLGIQIEFRPISWEAKEMELESKNIDCIWNGMSATPERQKSMALTDKYLNNKIVIMAADENVVIDKVEDLQNYKIGTQTDSAALEAMQANANFADFEANITEFETYDEAILALQGQRIDCMVVDQVLGEYKNSKLETPFIVCNYDFGNDFYAIGCRADDTAVAEKINEAIQALIDDGTAAEISNTWFGKNIVILEGYDK